MAEVQIPAGYKLDSAPSLPPGYRLDSTAASGPHGFSESLWNKVNPGEVASGLWEFLKASTPHMETYDPATEQARMERYRAKLSEITSHIKSGDIGAAANVAARAMLPGVAEAEDQYASGDKSGAAGTVTGELAKLYLAKKLGDVAVATPEAVSAAASSKTAGVMGDLVKKVAGRELKSKFERVNKIIQTGKDVKAAWEEVFGPEPQADAAPSVPQGPPAPPAKVPRTRKAAGPEPPRIIVASEYRPRPGMPPEVPADPPTAGKAPATAVPEAAAPEPPSELQRQLEESNRLIAEGKEARLSPDAKVAIAEKYGVRSGKEKVIAIDKNQGQRALKVAGFLDQNYEPGVIEAMGDEHFIGVGNEIGVKDMSAATIQKIKDLISMKRAMQQ